MFRIYQQKQFLLKQQFTFLKKWSQNGAKMANLKIDLICCLDKQIDFINKMFRQKIAEVSDCSCRLITKEQGNVSLFRTIVHTQKSVNKDHKQKYSLKSQAISSGKKDSRIISTKKTTSRSSKLADDRISISRNIDSKRKKLNRYKVCSPEGISTRNLDENATPSYSLPKNDHNFSKATYLFKNKDQIKPSIQSYKTFGALNQLSMINQKSKSHLIPTSFSKQKDKQNIKKVKSIRQNQRLNRRADKSLKKIRDMFQNQLPLRQITLNINYQLTHGSLQKEYQYIETGNILTERTLGIYQKGQKQDSLSKYELSKNDRETSQYTLNLYSQQNLGFQIRKSRDSNQINSCNTSQINQSTRKPLQNKNLATERKPKGNYFKSQCSQSSQLIDFLGNIRNNSAQQLQEQCYEISQMNSLNDQSNTHKKLQTFNDLMGQKQLCESIMSDQQDNQNQNSIVIMNLKDLIQKNKIQSQGQAQKISFTKNKNCSDGHKASLLTSQSDLITNQKPYPSQFKQKNYHRVF